MYKKYLSVSIMMLAPMCANAGGDYTAAIQQLDAEIARLQAQNQAGLEELSECEKKVKGFKISGITTLSLTGVGIGVNIGEAVKLNKLEQQSSALDTKISEKQAEIQKQKEEAKKTNPVSDLTQDLETKSEDDKHELADGASQIKHDDNKTVKEFLLLNKNIESGDLERIDFVGDSKSDTTQYVTQAGDWAVKFSYGVIKGVARCSITNGTTDKVGDPSDASGQYCWCKTTLFQKNGESNWQNATSAWVFDYDDGKTAQFYDDGSTSKCKESCTYNCAYNVIGHLKFREALFESLAN